MLIVVLKMLRSYSIYVILPYERRNTIERIFGVTKKRFQVLTHQLEYPYEIQVRLVKVIRCLHNIIRLTGGDDLFDELWAKSHTDTSLGRNSRSEVEAVVRKAVTDVNFFLN
jgi:hypothetical protein